MTFGRRGRRTKLLEQFFVVLRRIDAQVASSTAGNARGRANLFDKVWRNAGRCEDRHQIVKGKVEDEPGSPERVQLAEHRVVWRVVRQDAPEEHVAARRHQRQTNRDEQLAPVAGDNDDGDGDDANVSGKPTFRNKQTNKQTDRSSQPHQNVKRILYQQRAAEKEFEHSRMHLCVRASAIEQTSVSVVDKPAATTPRANKFHIGFLHLLLKK